MENTGMNVGTDMQEWIALGVVFLTATLFVGRPFLRGIRLTMARVLLKTGHVKWAMKLQHWGRSNSLLRNPHSKCES